MNITVDGQKVEINNLGINKIALILAATMKLTTGKINEQELIGFLLVNINKPNLPDLLANWCTEQLKGNEDIKKHLQKTLGSIIAVSRDGAENQIKAAEIMASLT